MERTGATVLVGMLNPAVRLLRTYSRSIQGEAQRRITELLLQWGIEPADLVSPEARIPQKVALEEGIICAEVTGDPAFSIHAACCVEHGDFGLFEYVVCTSATLGESIQASSRYLPLLSDGAEIDLVIQGDYAIFRHHLIANAPGPPSGHEFVMFSFQRNTSRALGFDARPLEVHFIHSKPAYVEEYERVYKAPIRFDMEYNATIMPRDALNIPLKTADPALHAILVRYAEQILETLAIRPPFTQRVRRVIRQQMTVGDARLKKTAATLHMSDRTLRRRLESEGTRYGEMVEEVRKELASSYLTTSELVIADIARRIGFATPPAFYRAFKRWYGVAPTEYRKVRARNPLYSFLHR
jgi:AraC-like DNA-binding protein